MHHSVTEMCICVHISVYKMMHCGIFVKGILGFVRCVYYKMVKNSKPHRMSGKIVKGLIIFNRIYVYCKNSWLYHISMALSERDITPVHQHWSYVSFALSHQYGMGTWNIWGCIVVMLRDEQVDSQTDSVDHDNTLWHKGLRIIRQHYKAPPEALNMNQPHCECPQAESVSMNMHDL